jgi:hypothetical protein
MMAGRGRGWWREEGLWTNVPFELVANKVSDHCALASSCRRRSTFSSTIDRLYLTYYVISLGQERHSSYAMQFYRT